LRAGKAQQLAVDHVVAVTAPGVQQGDAVAGAGVEQPRRRRETLRALLDAGPALLGDGVHQAGASADPRPASNSIKPAVAFAEPTTPGMPAPGWVPAPTRYRLATLASRLWGRNQALCVSTGSTEKAEPRWALSSSRKPKGVNSRIVTRFFRSPGM